MIKRLFINVLGVFILTASTSFAQGTVTIDHQTQRFLGDVSAFDRDKYTNAHILFNSTDAEFEAFKTEYNINSNYIGGRQFWNPLGMVKNGVIPSVSNKYEGDRSIQKGLVATGTAGQMMWDDNVDYSAVDITPFSQEAAAFVAKKYRDDWDLIPEYIEPFNEPMVHAIDYYPEGKDGKYITEKLQSVYDKISTYHKHLGEAIHNTPELKNMKVMGFASAYPEFEQSDFKSWNAKYKNFIDIAGAEMDAFSLHIYDGSGINNSGGRRSGSNAEAILDLIETYSMIKFQEVKPIAITEFGRLVPDQAGWTASNGASNYESVENSQAVRSQLHLVMAFMERANILETAIPFNVNTRDVTQKYCKSSIWINDSEGNAKYTNRRYYYEMLKDIKGDRVHVTSSNVDVQTQAFVDGQQLYVMLNNLNDKKQTVSLDLLNTQGLLKVDIKRLKIYLDKIPNLSTTESGSAPDYLSLEYGETVVLTYHFDSPIVFDNSIKQTKYYSSKHLEPISTYVMESFSFDNVQVGEGHATLRLGVARDRELSLMPIITINGEDVNTRGDIIRGYDQNTRNQFFGVLEIPFDISLLKEGTNKVRVTFSDGGGYISSVILQVEKAEASLGIGKIKSNDELKLYPNITEAGSIINIESSDQAMQCAVYHLDGRVAYQSNDNKIHTTGMQPGVYIVTAYSDGKRLSSKLIIN